MKLTEEEVRNLLHGPNRFDVEKAQELIRDLYVRVRELEAIAAAK